ncbi:hypothetical protein F4779DRAFT_463598 [Xylariaceae sp. FL0662B]|nr:hypothetical protein F4779DRAFT_463598 [Xylariaceae sp. FL0662B]
MSTIPIQNDGDDRSFDLESGSNKSSSHALPKPTRSLTPRGLLFSDLGEAHKKITSKLSSNNPFRDETEGNAHAHSSPPRDSVEPVNSTGVPRSQDDALSGPYIKATGEPLTHLRRVSSDPEVPKINMKSSARDNSEPTHIQEHNPTKSRPDPQDTSGSTVEKIYDQYTEAGGYQLASSVDNSVHGYTFSNAYQFRGFDPRSREGAVTRCGFRGEEALLRHKEALHEVCFPAQVAQIEKGTNMDQHRLQATSSPSKPPQNSPGAPQGQQRSVSPQVPNEGSSAFYASTVSDSQHLLDADAQADELRLVRQPLFPSPLRISSKQGLKGSELRRHEELFGDAGSSIVDGTNDSNDDPFKYDGGHYQAFLRPTKERDLSQALRRMSRVGPPSEGTLVSPEASPNEKTGTKRSTSKPSSRNNTTTSRRKRPEGKVFDSSAAMSMPTSEKQVRDIKVVINPRPRLDLDEGVEHDRAKESKKRDVPANDTYKTLPKDFASDGDWVTEATSEAGFGEGPVPRAQLAKATGSSIADFSDDEHIDIHGHFGSHDHILQHPVGQAQPESYELRNLKDTKQPIFLPKTRANRPTAFPENSIRLYSSNGNENDKSGQSRPPLLRKWSNPFTKGGKDRRGGTGGQFGYKIERNGPSKYDFRDSASEYTPAMPSNQATCGTVNAGTYGTLPHAASETTCDDELLNGHGHIDLPNDKPPNSQPGKLDSSREFQATPRIGYERRLVDEAYPIRYNKYRPRPLDKDIAIAVPCSYNGEPLSATSKFEFELLPLDQAQLKYKQQRESGETDETEDARVRYKRAKSNASSRGFSASSPIDPPLPTHARDGFLGPNLSSNFTPPHWHSLRYALQDSPTPFAATSQGMFSPTPNPSRSFKDRSSPLTPTPTYTATPATVKGKWFGREQARLLPERQTSRRNGTDRTVLHNRIAAERCISYKAHSRLKLWFYAMATLSILPFFAILVLTGVFNDSLAWFTRGEVYQLTSRQRKIIKYMFLVECVVYTSCIAAIIVYFVLKSKTS